MFVFLGFGLFPLSSCKWCRAKASFIFHELPEIQLNCSDFIALHRMSKINEVELQSLLDRCGPQQKRDHLFSLRIVFVALVSTKATTYIPIYRLLRVNSKLSPLNTRSLFYSDRISPSGIFFTFVVFSLSENVCYYVSVAFCVSPVSLCLGWWTLVRQATQRKGFTWVKLCWRMESSTMVSSLNSFTLRPSLSSFAVPYQ